jgi:transcriptional regulator with XRE-family HTH domain
MPTRLQAAREARGWSQPQLISRLTAKASSDGVHLPGLVSLKSMVSRWENGKAQPDPLYARLLREVYGLSDTELGLKISTGSGLDVETAADELARHLSTSAGLSMDTVKLLQEQTDRYRLLDRPLGAPRLLEQIRGHIAGLSEMLSYGVTGACRRPVAAVLADAATLAGWQALDVGALAQAWDHFETAKQPPARLRTRRFWPTPPGNRPTSCSTSTAAATLSR